MVRNESPDPARPDNEERPPLPTSFELEGRRAAISVWISQAGVWGDIWTAVARIQETNPDVRRIAETKTDDPEQAIVELVPQLMLLHPAIVRAVGSYCHGTGENLAYLLELLQDDDEPKAVSGALHTPAMSVERDEEASDAPDRLAELEDENRRLRIERDQLRDVLRLVRDLTDGPWVSESYDRDSTSR